MPINTTEIIEHLQEDFEPIDQFLNIYYDYKKNIIEKFISEGKLLTIIDGNNSTKSKFIHHKIFKDLNSVVEYHTELYKPTTDDGQPLWLVDLITEIKHRYGNQVKVTEIWDFNYQV